MKTFKTLLILLSLSFATQTNAQIWKKLGKKIEKAAEKTLEKKVEEKTERETSKAFDSTFNNSKGNKKNTNSPFKISGNKANPSKNYTFSHTYVMQINDGKRKTDLQYYLTNSGNYFGMKIPDDKENVVSVMDIDKKTMFMYMDSRGDKLLMSMGLDIEDMTEDSMDQNNVSVTATGNTKTILGYSCQEFKVKGDDMEGRVWITQNAGVSFAKSTYGVKTKKGLNQSWMRMLNGLFLEMEMTDTSKRKPKTMKMRCLSLDKTNITIKSSDYKKLM